MQPRADSRAEGYRPADLPGQHSHQPDSPPVAQQPVVLPPERQQEVLPPESPPEVHRQGPVVQQQVVQQQVVPQRAVQRPAVPPGRRPQAARRLPP